MLAVWSRAARSVWGKTDRLGESWLPLVQHLEDAAGVAGHLWDCWVPSLVRRRLAREIGGEGEARKLYVFLAGTHDVGKSTPAFAQLAHRVGRSELVSEMERHGLTSPRLGGPEMLRHTLTGHVALQEWLASRHNFSKARAGSIATVVSAHHGTPASDQSQLEAVRTTRAMGGAAWDGVRNEILDVMAEVTGATAVLARMRERKLSLLTLIDLSALVVVADWISSDEFRFPYDLSDPAGRLRRGLEGLDLRGSWEPSPAASVDGLFASRFPGLAHVGPTPLQRAAVDAVMSAESAPLVLIEAPTGAGKTEAALMAAEVLAARFGAGGVYVGLPTMATSNAMFGRVLGWVESWSGEQDPSMWLAHGKASLNEDFDELVRASHHLQVYDEGLDGGDEPDQGPARVSSWLQGRRRGLLANVVVGTVDQVLMGALQARHLALRHLALSGKVVLVDEVHSADVYMRSYLCRVLEYLGAYGTPVILLSATLPPAQRGELVAAYQRGRKKMLEPPTTQLLGARRPSTTTGAATDLPSAGEPLGPGPEAYPLVTLATDDVTHRSVEHDGRASRVRIERLVDDLGVLVDTVAAAVEHGGCVAVMRNTVRRAQDAYDALCERLGADVELFHSRFLAADRAVRERDLVRRLGPPGPGRQRPHRLVVVGTQVLEQSLDVDFDLLLTDLAPVDLVIQRIGRLHRHHRPLGDRPHGLTEPRCLITGVEDWEAQVPVIAPVLTHVNAESQLLRSLAVLQPHLDGRDLVLPEDGPILVHRAYDAGLVAPAGWESTWEQAEEDEARHGDRSRSRASVGLTASPWALTSLTRWTSTPADERREETGRAQVRDSEDGIEVLLLQRRDDGALGLLDGSFEGAGAELLLPPDDAHPTVRRLAACTVGLPQTLTNPSRWDRTVGELESNGVADDWQQSRWLRGQLVLVLGADGRTTLNGHEVAYDPQRGLSVERVTEEQQ